MLEWIAASGFVKALLPLFKWIEPRSWSVVIRQSTWIYPVDQALHLVFLTVLAGAILIVDLRLLGRGFREQPIKQVARDAQPWLIGGLLGMVATGVPQLMSNTMKEYYSPFFWDKMTILLLALLFTFTIRRRIIRMDDAQVGPVVGKIVGCVSIVLWLGVAIFGRLIGVLS